MSAKYSAEIIKGGKITNVKDERFVIFCLHFCLNNYFGFNVIGILISLIIFAQRFFSKY